MEYKTSYKRIKELMEIRANVQVLEVGVECTEQEKDDVVTFVVEYIPCASEAIRFLVVSPEEAHAMLRNQHDIFINVNHTRDGYSSWIKRISNNEALSGNLGYVKTYDEALLRGVKEAVSYLVNNDALQAQGRWI